MIQLGWCGKVEEAGELKRMGFDYIECPLASMSLENESEFKENLKRFQQSSLAVRAFNIFCPPGMKVVGPEADPSRIRAYILKAADVMNALGAEKVVFGSGHARTVPDGWEHKRAEEQFLNLLTWIGDAFAGTRLTLVIEPLNRKESNFINNLTEAVSYAKQIQHPNIKVLADFYHMEEEQEPLQALIDYKEWIAHIHVADTFRLSPGTGQYPYAEFMGNLKAAGYTGMISAECSVSDYSIDLPASLTFLRSWNEEVVT
ncbi:sugar phosphate isomerase/epimerase family protein [Paenibacillus gansuensis]|uniref:Sugar phosphate isomerase/epimerase family protein n=1 Tax=Paenibacillus gansuensis TaxID=306542 RepID=A0ABW5PIC2_9BACL